MLIPCALRLKDCLPCNDDPIQNITAEAPDVDVFIGFRDFRGRPPLGVLFAQIGCKALCFSTVSQRDADDCALRQAQDCTWPNWRPPVRPPVPPGPNGGPGGGPWPTPGGIPPSHPRNPLPTFSNTQQICEIECADGTVFTESVDAGTVKALTQALADEMAKSLACKRAAQDQICITSSALPAVCLGNDYSFVLQAEGGTSFNDHNYEWEVTAGDFPPGLDLEQNTGIISGIPFINGSYTFRVLVSDANANHQEKDFTICVMEIVTAATLPKAKEGEVYAQPLVQEPATVSSETWTLIGGTLPPGITLASNGALNGTPTDVDTFTFTLRCTADCSGSVSCERTFSLEVEPGVDCMGEAAAIEDIGPWTVIDAGINMTDGDGTFNEAGAFGGTVEATCQICNPDTDPYDVTATFDWTAAGFAVGINTQAIFRLNGVDHPSAVFNANGVYHFAVTVPLPSGVNTMNVYCTYTGAIGVGTLSGTVTVRPLTPPP